MDGLIIQREVFLIAMPLPQPFRLGFGVLHDLPRILLQIVFEREHGRRIMSIGEASIDFPFSPYDAWDIFSALSHEPLVGRDIGHREQILAESWKRREQDGVYAAQAALNMALDDACGRLSGQNLCALYGAQPGRGQILESIGIQESEQMLRIAVNDVYHAGRIPKIKCDGDVMRSCESLRVAASVSEEARRVFVTDFNATLSPEEWNDVVSFVEKQRLQKRLLFVEQPTREQDGPAAVVDAHRLSVARLRVPIVADESFVSEEDAKCLGEAGVSLNMKIQKVGGILRALQLERVAMDSARAVEREVVSMVGGTFPTALGRAYDQQAASVLRSVKFPSDGWQPATWFRGDQHLIREEFAVTDDGSAIAFTGQGLGCEPVWERIRQFVIPDPENEYRTIRERGVGMRLRIDCGSALRSYADVYEERSGRAHNWNLRRF